MTTPRRSGKDAAVLTGGGAKGAYEVGILKALFEGRSPATDYQPLAVEIFTGTSVGAYNAAFLTAQTRVGAPAAVERLAEVWRERIGSTAATCGNGVFRLRDAPLNALDPGCFVRPLEVLKETMDDAAFWARYLASRGTKFFASSRDSLEARFLDTVNLASLFDPTPLYDLVDDTVDPAGLVASDKALTIAATDWKHGKVKLFHKAELADVTGPVGLRGIWASTAIPGVFPAVEIDGLPFHDGGVLNNTPLKPAIRQGAEVIHVIFLDPQVVDIPLTVPANTIDTVYRMFLITTGALLVRDIELALSINTELALHAELGIMSEDFTQVTAESFVRNANSRVLQRLQGGRPYRSLTVHVYRPKTDLEGGAGLLDFSRRFISELIEMGYNDAIHHDCEESGCVIPADIEPTRFLGNGSNKTQTHGD